MVFSSIEFLFVFLPAVLLIYYILPKKLKNLFLLLANIVFYAYGEPVYVLLMIGSIILNFVAGKIIEKVKHKRLWLAFFMVVNLSALGFFKYTPFVFDTLRGITGLSFLPDVKIALPIGISFYTFQASSYLVDVYRKECKASCSIVDFATYISLFSQLIAGPIVRYIDVEKQLRERTHSFENFNSGIKTFTVGLAKKVLLANKLGILWEIASKNPEGMGTAGVWIGAIAYTLQIYFDFSGYSDMAIGLGKMLGFDFCINFNYPYIAKSITDFWRRWHISLSTWFRDYVYIPLGGNRVNKGRFCFNLMVVWALTGLWHGAGWNFVVWGLYYGVLLLAEKLFVGKLLKKLPSAVTHIYTLAVVIVGWIFFAGESFGHSAKYLKLMFTPNSTPSFIYGGIITIVIGIISAIPLGKNIYNKFKDKKYMYVAETVVCLALLVLSTAALVSDSYNPFLYFRF
ncbi:MAG: MBOAT family protein [Clostridia bacterium]|nr:MBOAT family protein [Clostridia bacterium]